MRLVTMIGQSVAVAAMLLVVACSSTSSDEAVADVGSEGVLEDVVTEDAVPADSMADVASDQTADAEGDLSADAEEDQVEGCEITSQGTLIGEDEEPTKFALGMFHFNIQYCAGGLKGFLPTPEVDLDEAEVEDRIIKESFEPLLDVLIEHPNWGTDLELQGLMIDVIRLRHPEVLEKMHQLVASGQIHLDSFHYSDQLWTAHPIQSMEWSDLFNREAFELACLPVGESVFTQEGQYGHGMSEFLASDGRISVLPKNLLRYYYGDNPVDLLYDWKGTPVIIGGKGVTQEVGGKTIEVTWHFMDDGEKAMTGELDPYFGTEFYFQESSKEKFVEEMEALEAQGYRIVTIADYVKQVKKYGFEPQTQPVVPDGAWQPVDTDNVYRWMGGKGIWGDSENDNHVLTSLTRSRLLLEAAETILDNLDEGSAKTTGPSSVRSGWKEQVLAEVSDGTGWNPWAGEIAYALTHSANAAKTASDFIAEAMTEMGTSTLWVDVKEGTVSEANLEQAPPYSLVYEGGTLSYVPNCVATDPVESLEVVATGWTATQEWCEISEGVTAVTIHFDDPEQFASRDVVVRFPRATSIMSYVPALTEMTGEATTFDVAEMPLYDTGMCAIPIANGLLGIGDNKWIVKVTSSVHLAARIMKDVPVVEFRNEAQAREPTQWTFLYLTGIEEEEAVEIANRLNVYPTIEIR